MSEVLQILQHALGVDKYGRGRRYRDWFVAGPGHSDFQICLEAERLGYFHHFERKHVVGGHIFIVTEAGHAFVDRESPAPPPTSRAQRRYSAFLDHDSGLSFGEWLRVYGAGVQ